MMKSLAGMRSGQHPFPLGHDHFAGADDPHQRVAVAGEFAVQAAARGAPAVVADAVDAGIVGLEALGQGRVAGDQIDRDLVAPGLAESGDQAFEQTAGAALHQQDGGDLGQAAGEEIAHLSDYNRRTTT